MRQDVSDPIESDEDKKSVIKLHDALFDIPDTIHV